MPIQQGNAPEIWLGKDSRCRAKESHKEKERDCGIIKEVIYMAKPKEIVYETAELQPPLSPDVAAMKRVVTALSALVKRAKKPAALAKEERDDRNQALLSDYQTEDDINEAY